MRLLHIILFITLFIPACASEAPPVHEKNGKKYGTTPGTFDSKWYDYYERALSYAEGGYFDEAISDFNDALCQKEFDKWGMGTYGQHHMDYFPNRELGVAYYYLGKSEEDKNLLKEYFEYSKSCLKASLEQTPTAKTLYYIERVYDQLDENGWLKKEDISEPFIIADSIKVEVSKDIKGIVTISGRIRDDKNYIKSIEVEGELVFWLNSKSDVELNKRLNNEISFTKQILFPEGKQSVEIKATNIMGKSAKPYEKPFYVDYRGPSLGIAELRHDSLNDNIIVKGFLQDESGVGESLFINKKKISVRQDGNGKRASFSAVISDSEQIELVAFDRLGNQMVSVQDVPKPRPVLLASTDTGNISVAQIQASEEQSNAEAEQPSIELWVLRKDCIEPAKNDGLEYIKLTECKKVKEYYLNRLRIRVELKNFKKNPIDEVRFDDVLRIDKTTKGTSFKNGLPVGDWQFDKLLVLPTDYIGIEKNIKVFDKKGGVTEEKIYIQKNGIKKSTEIEFKEIEVEIVKNEGGIFVTEKRCSVFIQEQGGLGGFNLKKKLETNFLNLYIFGETTKEKRFKMISNKKEEPRCIIDIEVSNHPSPKKTGLDPQKPGDIYREAKAKITYYTLNDTGEKRQKLEDMPIISAYMKGNKLDKLAEDIVGRFGVEIPFLAGIIDGTDKGGIITANLKDPKLRENYIGMAFSGDPSKPLKIETAKIIDPRKFKAKLIPTRQEKTELKYVVTE